MAVELIPVLKTKKKGKTISLRQQPPRTYYFKTWHTRITLELAQEEPPEQRLFYNSRLSSGGA